MKKILFALGSRGIELDIAEEVKENFKIVGAVTRKAQIIRAVEQLKPHILILREELSGNEDIKEIIAKLRNDYPYVRIIFLATNRSIGDTFLSVLVTYGVYDIINGNKVRMDDIVSLIYSPNQYKDISYLQPRIVFDEGGEYKFEMPEVINIERKTVVLESESKSKEDTEKLRRELEKELMVKVQAQLRDEYDKEYREALRVQGEAKEEEIKNKLTKVYREKLIEEKDKIHNQLQEEMSEKTHELIEAERNKMLKVLKDKEQELRMKMNTKIQLAMKEKEELKNKYESDKYEAELRKKFERELKDDIEKERLEIEKEIQGRYEEKKQKELKALKERFLKEMEAKSRRIIEEKEALLKEEMTRYKENVDSEKAKEIEDFKRSIESKKAKEIDEFRKNTELEKAKTMELYKQKLGEQEKELKNRLSQKMDAKVKSEVSRVEERIKREAAEKEALLRDEMNAKLKAVVNENKQLKNKYETKVFEDEVRGKLEKELNQKLIEEKRRFDAEMKKAVKAKEEELAREEESLRREIESNAQKSLLKLKEDLERQKEQEIEEAKNRIVQENQALLREEISKYKEDIDNEKMREMEDFKKQVESKKMKEIETVKKNAEIEKAKAMEHYKQKLDEQEKELKNRLSQKMDAKVKSEVSRVEERIKREAAEKEALLRDEMNAKLKAVVNENKQLKNKYETKVFEDEVRGKLEKELNQKLIEEKRRFDAEMKKAVKAKEEELAREEESLKREIESNAQKSLLKLKEDLERQKEQEIESVRQRVMDEGKKEINLFKEKLVKAKEEEVKKYRYEVEMEKQKEIESLEEKRKAELRRVEIEKQRELESLEERRQDELKRVERQKEEELRRIEFEMKREKEEFIKAEKEYILKSNQKIISFIAGKNGVGTTTVAVNVATQLALDGKRVLYVEMNSQTPSVGYWYQLENEKNVGLEEALELIRTERYRDVEECVLKSSQLKKGEYGKYYRKFPDKLDFLIFSKKEILWRKNEIEIEGDTLKNLYFYLMQNLGYEYIIMDLRVEDEDWIYSSFLFSSEIYQVLSQDVSSIAYLKYKSEQIDRKNINIERKGKYIVNRFNSKAKLSKRELGEFVGSNVLIVPDDSLSVMDSIYQGVPTIITTKNKEFKKSILDIVSQIKKK